MRDRDSLAKARQKGATSLTEVDNIARESRARGYRAIIRAIKHGIESGDAWSARYTAQAVIKEAFANTPAYYDALDRFCAALRVARK